jgi:hypothetical protein
LIWLNEAERKEKQRRLVIEGFDAASPDSLTFGDFYDAEITSPDKPAETMSQESDYRHELSLRDEQLRREMDLRQDSFRAEQAARDAAWNERFSGFLATQAAHDKVIDAKLDGITTKVEFISNQVGGFESKINATVEQVRKSNKATLGAMLTIGVAIVLGVWGVNSTIISSASGIFTAGQDAHKVQQANEQTLKQTQDLLEQIKSQMQNPAQPNAK